MTKNEYVPFLSKVLEVIPHTAIEYTFRMSYEGDVLPGQFFEVSIPKFGEAPISVSGIGDGFVDLTIRKVGHVTHEIFEHYVGDTLFMRGPYGNGFDVNNYKGKDIVIVAGGTGVSPVRGVMNYFTEHTDECRSLTIINGYKSADDILFKDDYPRYKEKANLILTLDAGEETADHHIGLVTKYIPDLQFEDLSQVAAIVVGPPAMMHFSVMALLQLGLEDHQVWISQERKMCCGLGKCGHCRIGDQYVCLDGPVFNYEKGKHLID
ncbi:MAG: anaerobic sulfite reductase subunit AsrB [Intestinibaculum porci]|jgi:anaerobic sulfite reductase subunit B|uniref:anaerobic sulfite reductase subunit AsrB n=1 Tax=Intestinibaculum porci TaxID=2487118 RepID=UPI003F0FC88C